VCVCVSSLIFILDFRFIHSFVYSRRKKNPFLFRYSFLLDCILATPKSIQSLAYLLRNEILDNLDNLRAELQYQLRLGQSQSPPPPPPLDNIDNDEIDEEVRQLITAAYTAMQKYLEIIPPNELQSAMVLLQQK
jgi:hypothetical protein